MPKLLALLFLFATLGSNSASAISTFQKWDGKTRVFPFSCSASTTYGQVITIPARDHNLKKIVMAWIGSHHASMVVRAEVFAWDGEKASGNSLYESAPRRLHHPSIGFRDETFRPPTPVTVTPGEQYVFFVSIDKDYEECKRGHLAWAAIDGDNAYRQGTFVYQNNAGDENRWTTTPWLKLDMDLAFHVPLSP